MEILKLRQQSVAKALLSLKDAIEILHDPQYKKIYNALRDSLIQRFEYTIDNFWKFLRLYLAEKYKITVETVTPSNFKRISKRQSNFGR